MPAIAAIEDIFGWILRGFVEGGVSDGTGRGAMPTEAGVMDAADLLGPGRGSQGIRLAFLHQARDLPGPEDEYHYSIKLVREPQQQGVLVRCADCLYFKVFPESPPESLGARILADIRAHNQTFTTWRRKGGELAYGEREGVPDIRGMACSAGLSNFLERHYKSGATLAEGPDHGWWNERFAKRSLGRQIGIGGGQEAFVMKKALTEAQLPENRAWLKRVEQAGVGMIVSGALSLAWCGGLAMYALYRWYDIGFGSMFTMGWPVASLVLTGIAGGAQVWAGMQARALESAFWVQGIAIFAIIPCGGPCCIPALPSSLYTLWTLRDDRTERLFQS